jgi:hypothetical protein
MVCGQFVLGVTVGMNLEWITAGILFCLFGLIVLLPRLTAGTDRLA